VAHAGEAEEDRRVGVGGQQPADLLRDRPDLAVEQFELVGE